MKRCSVSIVAMALTILTGCSTVPGKFGHTYSPTWDKFTASAVNAAKDPGTWIPLAGTVVVMASGQDERITQDALRNNHIFGSQENASRVSDQLMASLDVIWLGTVFAADAGEFGTTQWTSNKTSGLFTQIAIIDASHLATDAVKSVVTRREPNRKIQNPEGEGFPSGHSTPPFAQAALIRRNLEWTNVSSTNRTSILVGTYTIASLTAYARVEAGLHHYSDQLAGVALGNWIGLTLHDTFMERSSTYVGIVPINEGAMVTMNIPF